jgi:hypothetical protein
MEAAGLKTKIKILVKVICIFPDVTTRIYNSCGYHSFRSARFSTLTTPDIFVLHSEFEGAVCGLQ